MIHAQSRLKFKRKPRLHPQLSRCGRINHKRTNATPSYPFSPTTSCDRSTDFDGWKSQLFHHKPDELLWTILLEIDRASNHTRYQHRRQHRPSPQRCMPTRMQFDSVCGSNITSICQKDQSGAPNQIGYRHLFKICQRKLSLQRHVLTWMRSDTSQLPRPRTWS